MLDIRQFDRAVRPTDFAQLGSNAPAGDASDIGKAVMSVASELGDAKAQAGQGLSRLLNVVDGIIGQGLRVIVLVTTNDDLRQLHPAVSRPGRCLAKVEFVPFTPEEAKEWLDRNGVDRNGRAGTLASLFGSAAGEETPERVPVGFVR